jgi:hypothetical protein
MFQSLSRISSNKLFISILDIEDGDGDGKGKKIAH